MAHAFLLSSETIPRRQHGINDDLTGSVVLDPALV